MVQEGPFIKNRTSVGEPEPARKSRRFDPGRTPGTSGIGTLAFRQRTAGVDGRRPTAV